MAGVKCGGFGGWVRGAEEPWGIWGAEAVRSSGKWVTGWEGVRPSGVPECKMPFPPSGSGIADMDPRQNLKSFNFVRQDIRANAQVNFNNTDNGAAMSRTATGEKPFSSREGFPFSSSRAFTKDHEQYSKKKRDFVHVLLKRKKTFVTVTDSSGNKKTGASAGCLEDRKGRSRLSRYASEAVAEHVGRSARKMGLSSVVMKVKGASFFKKKKKVILSFREGFRGERVRDRSPIMYIHDVTQLPHNGCRLRKQRRV
ncbi:unnamed protein product [Miscanthus lutarioriparius]|uniref:Ribosomal protein S11 n=1 Tax=Miscanthus lutarioriparius TaxID=422564 RepID=A0A811RLG4_9POAL|nr:unnamed protein product [Miscanthus lutarioriparius]